jgi:predicted RNase H-like nuclease (RuvC/YqgF family)
MPNDNADKTNLDDPSKNSDAATGSQKKDEDTNKPSAKTNEGKTDENKTFSEEYVKDLRRESANYRQQAKDLQKKAEDADAKAKELGQSAEAAQQEARKALDETKRLQSAYEQRLIRAELKAAAMEEGLVDMDAFKMMDLSSVKIADDGEITGVKELIGDFKKSKPYLFKEVTTSNKDSGAPPADKNAGEKPTYSTPKEFNDAKKKYFSSLR